MPLAAFGLLANCWVISLAAVNFFLFCVGSIQLARIYQYRRSTGSKPLAEEIKDAAAESVETVKKAVKA